MSNDFVSRRRLLSLMAGAPFAMGAAASFASAAEGGSKGKILMPVGDATEVVDTLYPFFRGTGGRV